MQLVYRDQQSASFPPTPAHAEKTALTAGTLTTKLEPASSSDTVAAAVTSIGSRPSIHAHSSVPLLDHIVSYLCALAIDDLSLSVNISIFDSLWDINMQVTDCYQKV